ncbi:MAG: hypothetical protein AMXMBFR47_39050 [Planctomycetota bacterium]
MRDGLATEGEALQFLVTFLLPRELPLTVEFTRHLVERPDEFSTVSIDQLAEIVADALDTTSGATEPVGVNSKLALIDLILDHLEPESRSTVRLAAIRQGIGRPAAARNPRPEAP